MQDLASFGRWVKRRRLALGLTQDVLAERVGCATQTVRKIEGGQRRPSYQMAQRLARALELTAEEREAFMQAARASDEQDPPGAPVAAPAVRNLPAYHTPFVGREEEQTELARLLAQQDCRLITLLGPGGIGKTRLAVEAAARCEGFRDGVVFVPLAGIGEPQAVVPAIADALALAGSGSSELSVQLVSYLRDRQILLVLDNVEHLLGGEDVAIGLIGEILAQAPGVKLLVTSRERLRLQAEWLVPLEGLQVPPERPGDHGDYPALTLFLNHAQRVQHGFRLAEDDYRAVARICRFVGGMPLGLELAAAWVRVLSPQEISEELARGLDALSLTARDLPERHHSLQAVFDHSWRLLSDAERRVLRQLAVFQGGCTREAAAAVADASLGVLATLVDKSLLQRTRAGRYDMHALIRQYALARLQEHEQEYVAARGRHSAYYALWLEARERPLQGAAQAATVTEISVEIDNLRAAWEWAVGHRRLEDVRRSAETLHWFFEFRGWFAEGEALFRSATDGLSSSLPAPLDSAAPDQPSLGLALGQVLAVHGYLASRLGEFDQALRLLEQSLVLLRQYGDSVAVSRALAYEGIVTYQTGDYLRSRRSLLASLEYARADGDKHITALCLTWLSMVEHALGAYREAEQAFHEALALWRAIGNPRTVLFCITFCSVTLYALEKHDEAHALLNESLGLAAEIEDRWGLAMTLDHLGLNAYGRREYHEALSLFYEALELLRTTGTRWEIARVRNRLGMALAAIGAEAEAKQSYREALAMAAAAHALPEALQSLVGLAELLARQGQHKRALTLLAHVQDSAAARIETRAQAHALRAAILPHFFSSSEAAPAAEASPTQLPELVSELLGSD